MYVDCLDSLSLLLIDVYSNIENVCNAKKADSIFLFFHNGEK